MRIALIPSGRAEALCLIFHKHRAFLGNRDFYGKERSRMSLLKRWGKRLLFPPLPLSIALIPLSAVLLPCAFVWLGDRHPLSALCYAVSAYTLTVWCARIPSLVRRAKRFKRENRYMRRWSAEPRLRVKLSLLVSLLMNTAYAAFQLGLGLFHDSLWFYSLAAYYFLLVLMRILLFRDVRDPSVREDIDAEWKRYRFCGVVLAIMNVALMGIVVFISYFGRGAEHHFITTLALAAYTFTAMAVAIVSALRYRRYHSPVFSATKVISLVSAAVSMLMLETAMLSAFGDEATRAMRPTITLLTGISVCLFVMMIAVYMIARANTQLKRAHDEKQSQKSP